MHKLALSLVCFAATLSPALGADTVYVHVKDGIVDNRAVFDTAVPNTWPDRANWIASGTADIGWTYSGGQFAAPLAAPLPPPSAVDIRDQQFRSDQTRADLLAKLRTATPAQIDAYIDANMTTLAQARVVIKALLKVVALNVAN